MEVFGNPVSNAHAARFPSHGWAVDVEGERRLFFPILTVFAGAAAIRARAGMDRDVGITYRRAARSFTTTLWKLAVVLRDLEGLARAGWARGDHTEFVAAREAFDRAPLLIEWAFGYLRRLADRFALAAAPALFRHLNSTPSDFPGLLDHAGKRFSDLGPLVNGEELQRLLIDNSGWVERLRRTGTGYRDTLEHDSAEVDILLVSDRGGNDGVRQWLEAVMSHGPTDELVGVLRDLCAGLCDFLTGMCRLVQYADSYRYDDGLIVSGPEELVLAFWPGI
jgi:hypothetical protein